MSIKNLSPIGLLLSLVLCLLSCAHQPSPGTAVTEGPRFELSLEPGPHYESSSTWLFFRVPIYPQVAVWAESAEGRFLATLHVTEKTARGSFMDAPPEGRPEALPVWSGRRTAAADAVSSATPRGETGVSTAWSGREAGTVHLYLETNRSYDWNDRYTAGNAGVSGQPSVVYHAVIDTSAGPCTAAFVPIGTGSADGSDGEVHPGLEGIDTALALFSRLEVAWKE